LHLNPYGHSPCVTSSLTRRWACLLWICLAFVKCTCRTYSMLLKNFPSTIYTSPLSVQALQCRSVRFGVMTQNRDRTAAAESSIVASVTLAPEMCLSRRCLATAASCHLFVLLMGGIYEVQRWHGLWYHGIHTKFHKDWFRHYWKVLFFRNKKSRLKVCSICWSVGVLQDSCITVPYKFWVK
jgi:hypothetical protein